VPEKPVPTLLSDRVALGVWLTCALLLATLLLKDLLMALWPF
jgi:hypothetical protein